MVSGLAVLAVAACGQGGDSGSADKAEGAADKAAMAEMPTGPTPGLWRVTTEMSGASGVQMPPVETCIRQATFEPPAGAAPQSPGLTCEPGSFRREGEAMVGRTVCTTQDGVRTVTDMRVTGDYRRAYRMEVKSTMTPAPIPSMAEVTMVMNAERLGDCPAESAPQ